MTDTSLGYFPGHGTGTGSVIVADHTDPAVPWGVSPGAKLIPLRVSSSVIHFSFTNLSDAITEAISRKADVISMSLGGPAGSALLMAQIWKALDQGIIVVSAAGNYAPTVVFPARIPGVIAVAADNALQAPWRFSGMGSQVTITAPGELVWHDVRRVSPAPGKSPDDEGSGSGTSFATANVAGLAALWLSYYGRDTLIQHLNDRPELLPFAFQLCLQRSAQTDPSFIRSGAGGFGAGIARADDLLKDALPSVADADAARQTALRAQTSAIVDFPTSSWRNILTLPTIDADRAEQPNVPPQTPEQGSISLDDFLRDIMGPNCDANDRREIGALAANDQDLDDVITQVIHKVRGAPSADAIRRYLLDADCRSLLDAIHHYLLDDARRYLSDVERRDLLDAIRRYLLDGDQRDHLNNDYTYLLDVDRRYLIGVNPLLSPTLRTKLEARRAARMQDWRNTHVKLGESARCPDMGPHGYPITMPRERRLRAYALDPSMANRSDTAKVNQITISVTYEPDLQPGPVGEYLEVVDIDPASNSAYAPVDLDHPHLLASDGFIPSEGNPQFHQQMVYAVAMKTIRHFEEALGRPVFWSSLRPWNEASGDKERACQTDSGDQFVQRLRLYPHAMRAKNAYYSPQKRAILFGYFPADDDDPGNEYPGGVVFACLSHDIVAHETTHAILDGMHVFFTEETNPDVLAFHEGFADIVALFQHFTYPELLRDQIGRASGQLSSGTLLTQLAMQFGRASGEHGALRDALGAIVLQRRARTVGEWRDRREDSEMDPDTDPGPTIRDAARSLDDEDERRIWKRYKADPMLMSSVEEAHARGSLLVAAIFDAFLTIYENRIADLKRIATGGSGILPSGRLHPDLVNRLAEEAAAAARHVLRICIRALDYVPPTDITFGEYLRALITADYDVVPDDTRGYRVAFIEAFRAWGIYPRDVRTLSEDTLVWQRIKGCLQLFADDAANDMRRLQRAVQTWRPQISPEIRDCVSSDYKSRSDMFDRILKAQRMLHSLIQAGNSPALNVYLDEAGIDTRRSFSVSNLRPCRRMGTGGDFLTDVVFEVIQSIPIESGSGRPTSHFRGGVTFVVSMETWIVRYAIIKSLKSERRLAAQKEHQALRAAGTSDRAAEYCSQAPPDLVRDKTNWEKDRMVDREAMRISSANCRSGTQGASIPEITDNRGLIPAASENEPFAMLHRVW